MGSRIPLTSLLLLSLVTTCCAGFESLDDAGSADATAGGERDGGLPDHAPPDGPVPDRPGSSGCSGPGAGKPPMLDAFSITDQLDEVVLEQQVSLSVQARPAVPGEPLTYRFAVSPSTTDAVTHIGDGTARWGLTNAPPVFFTTPFEISVEVSHACGGPAATAKVTVKVVGNVLVANHAQGSIEALGSNGKWLGQVIGPAVLTSPTDMVLLASGELAVGDSASNLIKVIDLTTQTLARSFGSAVTNLSPNFLERDAGGGLLVAPVSKNQIARFDSQGQLLGLLEPPHPYEIAGIARRSDGTVIVGTSGIGRLYAFSAAGQSLGLWADVPGGSDTNSLLAVGGNELLAGLRASMNDGLLARLSPAGAVVETVDGGGPGGHVYYFLEPFLDGYLFVHIKDRRIYRMDGQLKPVTAPFATLPTGAWPMGIVWLDEAP